MKWCLELQHPACFLPCYYFSPPPSWTAPSCQGLHFNMLPSSTAIGLFTSSTLCSSRETKLCSPLLSPGVMCDQQLPTHSDCRVGSSSSSSTAPAASRAQHGSASSQPAPCGESTRKVKWPPGKGWAGFVVEKKLSQAHHSKTKCHEFFASLY